MKARRVWLVFAVLIAILAVGCSEQENLGDLKLGKYVKLNAEGQAWAWVSLAENNKFQFNRNIATSYMPCGTYEVKDDMLILTVSEKEVYKFGINGDKIILEDDIGNLLKRGDVFEYKESDSDL
jgi:hypothetical protein